MTLYELHRGPMFEADEADLALEFLVDLGYLRQVSFPESEEQARRRRWRTLWWLDRPWPKDSGPLTWRVERGQ